MFYTLTLFDADLINQLFLNLTTIKFVVGLAIYVDQKENYFSRG